MNLINREYFGNPSSLHTKGIEAERLVRKSREAIAASLGAESKEIYFTSGGTESNNLAVMGYLRANPRKGRHIITSMIEHPSVMEVYRYLAENGYEVDYLKVDDTGTIDLDDLKSKIRKETALISIIYINNEIGTIQPIEEIAKIKNSINKDAALHIDAVQAYGKTRIYRRKLGVDMLSMSSHKIHGPKGVGALYVHKNIRLKPVLFGGGQESLIRSGTENVPGVGGFGLASEMIFKDIDENYNKVAALKENFIALLKSSTEEVLVISPQNSSPYILNVSFGNIKAEVLLHHLEEKGIFVSTGSACSSRKNVHSHVLKSIGIKACDIEGAIRFSFSAFNTDEEIKIATEAIKEIMPKIKIKKR